MNCNGITPFPPPWFHYLTLFLKFNYLTLSFYVTGLDELLWFACFFNYYDVKNKFWSLV